LSDITVSAILLRTKASAPIEQCLNNYIAGSHSHPGLH